MTRGSFMFATAFQRLLVFVLGAIILTACGGGGGDSGSGGGGNHITVDTSLVSFSANLNGTRPPAAMRSVTFSSSVAQYAYGISIDAPDAPWLSMGMSGTGLNYTLTLSVNSTNLPAGTYNTVARILAGDANGNVIDQKDIPVRYTVSNKLAVNRTSLAFNYTLGGTQPGTQVVQISGNSLSWNAVASQPWVTLSSTSGTTPSSLTIGVDTTGMSVGTQNATITLTNPGNAADTVSVNVQLNVLAPTLSLSTYSQGVAYAFGSSVLPGNIPFSITGYQIDWTASSNQPWLTLDNLTGSGNTALNAIVDVSGLAPGTHVGYVTFTNDSNASDQEIIAIMVNVISPTITLSSNSITLGGTDGRDSATLSIDVSVNTGSNSYPWSIVLDTGANGAWIVPDATSGSVSTTPQTIAFDADRSVLTTGGVYQGTATVSVDVNGLILSDTIDITLNYEQNKLYVDDNGFAFVSTPSVSRLSDSIEVKDIYGTTTSNWTAVSSQPWLTVTTSGVTGDAITMTVDTLGLSTDAVYDATVTITSSDADISNAETIRVGLWVGSTDANASDLTASNGYAYIAADPVRPYVYAHSSGTDIDVYNVYTAAYVRTISNVAPQLYDIKVSTDGSTLYAADITNADVIEINLDTDAFSTLWDLTVPGGYFQMEYARYKGVPILFAYNKAYRLDTKTEFANAYTGLLTYMSASRDGSTICSINSGYSPCSGNCKRISYSPLIDANNLGLTSLVAACGGSNGKDVAVNHDGSRVYFASGAPYNFRVYDTATGALVQTLPGDAYPSNVQYSPVENRVYAGCIFCGNPGTWVYDDAGFELTNYSFGVSDRTVLISGDDKRMMTLSGGSIRIVNTP